MNKNIILDGPTETLVDATAPSAAQGNKQIALVQAHTDLVISDIVYQKEAQPANASKVTAFTLPVGGYLFRVKSIVFTGTATIVYTGIEQP